MAAPSPTMPSRSAGSVLRSRPSGPQLEVAQQAQHVAATQPAITEPTRKRQVGADAIGSISWGDSGDGGGGGSAGGDGGGGGGGERGGGGGGDGGDGGDDGGAGAAAAPPAARARPRSRRCPTASRPARCTRTGSRQARPASRRRARAAEHGVGCRSPGRGERKALRLPAAVLVHAEQPADLRRERRRRRRGPSSAVASGRWSPRRSQLGHFLLRAARAYAERCVGVLHLVARRWHRPSPGSQTRRAAAMLRALCHL